jgi:GMP synthase-like glutamine amidotransferase
MRCATILQQVEFEGPQRITQALELESYEVTVVRLFAGEPVPRELPDETFLVVMGGPMGVSDVDSDDFPFLRQEIDLLEHRVRADAPTLGICLGAQLLAFAAGARVRQNTRPARDVTTDSERVLEVGFADVAFDASVEAAVLEGIPELAPMFHWHGDTFDLPDNSRLFASTPACKAQAFRLKQRLFGLQFHPEVEPGDIAELLRVDEAYAVAACGPDAARTILSDTERLMPTFRSVGDRLLSNIVIAATK